MVKKFKKSFMSLILFLMYANNIYATTTGTYTVSEKSSGIGKFFLLLVGVLLVSLVLFVGYVMDKNENTKKEREKFIKKHKENLKSKNKVEEETEDEYEDYDSEENDDYEDDEEDDDEEYDDDESGDENYYTQKINLTTEYDKDEEDEIDSLNDLERNLIEKYIDEDDLEDTEEVDDEENDDDSEVTEDNDYEENQYYDNNEEFEDDEDEEILIKDNSFNEVENNLMNSTMIFNSVELKKGKNKNTVKGYDYEEDDLSELESMIKAANIKRYTRKKTNGEEILKPRKKVIVFKKEKNDDDIIAKTRKKMAKLKEHQELEIDGTVKNTSKEVLEKDLQEKKEEVKVPAKRGRKPGSKNKPKEPAKRGRKPGSKNKTTAKKRGRPPKKSTKKSAKSEK